MTRPGLDDVLSGVQRLLQTEIVPALAEQPFLVEQVMYATAVLEYCKKAWPRAHLALAEEHTDLCATLRAVAEQAREVEDAGAFAAELRAAVEAEASDPAATPLDVLAEKNRTLRKEVSRAVQRLAERPDAGEARRLLDAYLARLAARQRAELELLGINW